MNTKDSNAIFESLILADRISHLPTLSYLARSIPKFVVMQSRRVLIHAQDEIAMQDFQYYSIITLVSTAP